MIHYSSFKTPMAKAVRHPYECERKRQTRRFGKIWQVGDIVGFKETWSLPEMYDSYTPADIVRKIGADRAVCVIRYAGTGKKSGRVRSYMHMPHALVGLFGRITEVRGPEPIQSISNHDAMMEGAWVWANNPDISGLGPRAADALLNNACGRTFQTDPESGVLTARGCMAALWDSIYGDNPEKCWSANPAPTAYTFELITREEALGKV